MLKQISNLPSGRLLGDRVVDLAARGLIGLARLLPYRRRVPFMGWLMRHMIGRIAPYHKRTRTHLALIFPELSSRARRRIASASLDNMGRTLIEYYSEADFKAHNAHTVLQGPGLVALQASHDEGRPIIVLTGHFGNYEIIRMVLRSRGLEVGAIYREMANPYFHKHYVKALKSYGEPVFAKGSQDMRGIVAHLRSGGCLGILNDQHTMGAPVLDFLGHPAQTALSAATLALKFNALVLPVFCIRMPDGLSFQCFVEDPIAHSDAMRMTQEMNHRLAARIRAHPEQWFWVARRWRVPS